LTRFASLIIQPVDAALLPPARPAAAWAGVAAKPKAEDFFLGIAAASAA